jgi:hypothetical protein
MWETYRAVAEARVKALETGETTWVRLWLDENDRARRERNKAKKARQKARRR